VQAALIVLVLLLADLAIGVVVEVLYPQGHLHTEAEWSRNSKRPARRKRGPLPSRWSGGGSPRRDEPLALC
jgi:hypothetical protein